MEDLEFLALIIKQKNGKGTCEVLKPKSPFVALGMIRTARIRLDVLEDRLLEDVKNEMCGSTPLLQPTD